MEGLEDFLCFRIGALSRRIVRYYNERLSSYGITLGQLFVLVHLLDHDGCNLKSIATGVQLETPAITGLVDRLRLAGLVIKTEDPEDRRNLQVFLTPKGKQLADHGLQIALDFNQTLKNDLIGDDLTALERSLFVMEEYL